MIGDIAHVCNRGVNKENIFLNNSYYCRFVESLYKLNNKSGALRYEGKALFDNLPKQEKLVEILKWSLMPNHYHLLLYEVVDGGIVEFTKRLGNSYTKYFNIKNERSGYLFQNAAKIIRIDNQAQQNYIPLYIDLNPLDILKIERKGNIKNDLKKLANYRWSSFGDYFDVLHFPEITNVSLFYNLFNISEKAYKKDLCSWLKKNPSTCHVDGF